jgi:hypothetical protein
MKDIHDNKTLSMFDLKIRGGKRVGAGRKPKPKHQLKGSVVMRIPLDKKDAVLALLAGE